MKYTWILTTALLLGCSEDFLDVPLNDRLSQETLWLEGETAAAAVTGVYNQLTELYDAPYTLDAATPNAFSRDVVDVIAQGAQTAASGGIIGGTWGESYELIGRANTVLDNINQTPIEADLITRYKAEALFLRALGYFNLWSLYGGVPLITSAPSAEQGEFARNTAPEVVDQMVKDLDDAAAGLPPAYSGEDLGRATSGAALALKSRVLLYAASDLFGGTNSAAEWQAAAAAAQAVIDLNQYQLGESYRELFRDESSPSRAAEAIFQVSFLFPEFEKHNVERELDLFQFSAPLPNLVDDYLMTDGLTIEESPLYDPATPYANRDPRLSATVTLPGTLYNGSEVTADRYPDVGGYVLKKYTVFPDEEFGGDPSAGFSDNDVMVLRYGEILLNYAEAQNEATGPDASVYAALNQLRNRAGVAEVTPGLSPEEMRQVIRLERRIELVGEGLYYDDIRRWRIAEDVMNSPVFKVDGTQLATRSFNPDRDYLLPIPEVVRDLNPNLEQNPNY